MTVTTAERVEITAPDAVPFVGDLRKFARVIDTGSLPYERDLYESYANLGFMDYGAYIEFCDPAYAAKWGVGGLEKEFDQTTKWVDGFRMAAYMTSLCKGFGALGGDETEMRAAYERAEGRVIATAIVNNVIIPSTDPLDQEFGSTGTPVKPMVGLALAEAAAIDSQRVLYMDPTLLAYFAGKGAIEIGDGDVPRTNLGTPVAAARASYSYTASGLVSAIHASGPVTVIRGNLAYNAELDRGTNDRYTLLERGYVVAAEGPFTTVTIGATD